VGADSGSSFASTASVIAVRRSARIPAAPGTVATRVAVTTGDIRSRPKVAQIIAIGKRFSAKPSEPW
jgi:hypothetical protein